MEENEKKENSIREKPLIKQMVDSEGAKHEKVPEKIPKIKELREYCQRKRNVWYWRDRFNRGISIYITKIFLHLGAVPNHASFFVFFFGILSAVFYGFGIYTYSLIGLFLHHLSFVMDAVDGEIARYKKMCSMKGVYLDLMSHIILNPIFVVGMAIGSYIHSPNYLPLPNYTYLIAGGIGSFSILFGNFVRTKKYELLIKKEKFDILKKENETHNFENPSWIKNELLFLLSFELFNLMFFFTILNLVPILVLIYAVIFLGIFLIKVYRTYHSIKE